MISTGLRGLLNLLFRDQVGDQSEFVNGVSRVMSEVAPPARVCPLRAALPILLRQACLLFLPMLLRLHLQVRDFSSCLVNSLHFSPCSRLAGTSLLNASSPIVFIRLAGASQKMLVRF